MSEFDVVNDKTVLKPSKKREDVAQEQDKQTTTDVKTALHFKSEPQGSGKMLRFSRFGEAKEKIDIVEGSVLIVGKDITEAEAKFLKQLPGWAIEEKEEN